MRARPRSSALIVQRAAGLRSQLTPTEAALWRAIRGKRLGAALRRQVPIGRYIADFLAPRERLVVEVDGAYHADRRRADARRDEYMRRAGYRVLRLEAELVRTALPVALERIRLALRPP